MADDGDHRGYVAIDDDDDEELAEPLPGVAGSSRAIMPV